jgi:hypothetical protein
MATERLSGTLRGLAHDLISLETNTILSSGITGQKMPSYPHALQDIIGEYAKFLAFEVGIDVDGYCRAFRDQVVQLPEGATDALPKGMEDPDIASADNDRAARAIGLAFGRPSFSTPLPNGPWAFSLLRWLAANALAQSEHAIPEQQIAVITRIRASSDELKVVARQLKQLDGGNPYIGVTREAILGMEAQAKPPAVPPAPPQYLTVIRKIWDIGTDSIVFQTVQQLDGDVIFRVRRRVDLASRQALLKAHQEAASAATAYWQSMFELIATLISGLADRLFGPSSRGGGA